MSEKIRLTPEQKTQNNENIEKIKTITAELKKIVSELHGVSITQAYDSSVSNLETKNEKYLVEIPFQVSDEEKELIAKLREGKAKIQEVSTVNNSESSNESVDMDEPQKTSKRKH